jgi:hypothetical protein
MIMKKLALFAILLILATALCACCGGDAPAASDGATSGAPTTGAASSSQATQTTAAAASSSQSSTQTATTKGTAASSEDSGRDSNEAPVEEGETFTLTLIADLSGGSTEEGLRQTKEITLPVEEQPASQYIIATTLADGLSAWTGLDFALNDVLFNVDNIIVDWSADSTLIAGLGDREPNPDFNLSDPVSINWFLMDSMAETLKYNMDVSTIYYCSIGRPIPFTNPDDMAAQGLPELPVDQPYEGSAFFVAHSDGRGDPGDLGDTNDPAWWGEYMCADTNFSIGISNYDGTSFRFYFSNLRNGEYFYDGAAALFSDDAYLAEFGDISFALSEDFNSIDISAPESSEWAHLSGRYERVSDDFDTSQVTGGGNEDSLRIDVSLDGLVLDSGNEYILDGEVSVRSETLDALDIAYDEDGIRTYIDYYLSIQDREVSEWLSLTQDEELAEKTSYPVWIAEYYVGHNEDTNLCVDAVVLTDGYTLILHTLRDADLDMNTDTDYGARIREMFETMDVVTVE